MVDHPSKLPPGAVVVERREKTERAAEPAAPEPPPPARWDGEAAEARPAGHGGLPASSRPEDAAVCIRLGLPEDCSADQVRSAEHWCESGQRARLRVEEAERALERAEEDLENCEIASLRGGYCSEGRLEHAQLELEDAERSLDGLEGSCRNADCLPGWVRDDCAR
jgi:hypothetical protein